MNEDKKRYYALDDIGYLGSKTTGINEAELQKEMKRTAQYVKDLRTSKKPGRRSAKKIRK